MMKESLKKLAKKLLKEKQTISQSVDLRASINRPALDPIMIASINYRTRQSCQRRCSLNYSSQLVISSLRQSIYRVVSTLPHFSPARTCDINCKSSLINLQPREIKSSGALGGSFAADFSHRSSPNNKLQALPTLRAHCVCAPWYLTRLQLIRQLWSRKTRESRERRMKYHTRAPLNGAIEKKQSKARKKWSIIHHRGWLSMLPLELWFVSRWM